MKTLTIFALLALTLAACAPGMPATTDAPVPTATSTPLPPTSPHTVEATPTIVFPTASPLPTEPIIPIITPDAIQVEIWKEYETALANSFFSSFTPEVSLCEWEILGRSNQEVYVWAVCDIPEGGRGASAPAVIYLKPDGFIQNVKILGKSSDYGSDILKLPTDVQQKLDPYRFGREKLLWEHLEWRRTHPKVLPLIVFSATPTP